MPRIGRLHIPGGCYHIIGRGLERRYIFEDTADKQDFLSRLGENLERSDVRCLAWTVMSNHYHLLIRAGAKPLAKMMAPLLGGFAGSYNRRHGRSGYVFQNRFTSILCEAESYLLELTRYIHLNPVRAGMIEDLQGLDHYPWTGHAGIMGKHCQKWQSIDEVLSLFDERVGTARKLYREFLFAGIKSVDVPNLSGGGLVRSHGGWESLSRFRQEHVRIIGDERILGHSEFVEQALSQDDLALDTREFLRRGGWDLEKLIRRVCSYCDVSEERLLTKARSNKLSVAKTLICHWGAEKLGCSTREIAVRLGISQPAVSRWNKLGRSYCERERIEFRNIVN